MQNEKLIINTRLLRKEPNFEMRTCIVEKAVAADHDEFKGLKKSPLLNNQIITENKDIMYCDKDDVFHCLLIYDKEQGDGLLIEAEGADYARYAQYVPNAKLLYEDHIQNHLQEMKLECTEEAAAEESEELQMDMTM